MDDTHHPDFLRGVAMILVDLVRWDRHKEAADIVATHELCYDDFAAVVDEADLEELRAALWPHRVV